MHAEPGGCPADFTVLFSAGRAQFQHVAEYRDGFRSPSERNQCFQRGFDRSGIGIVIIGKNCPPLNDLDLRPHADGLEIVKTVLYGIDRHPASRSPPLQQQGHCKCYASPGPAAALSPLPRPHEW